MTDQPKIRWNFVARAVLMLVAVAYLVACGGLYAWQDEMVFAGAGNLPDLPPAPAGWETHEIEHDEGKGIAWFYRQPRPGPVVLMMHGNGDTLAGWPRVAKPWIDRGYSVLLPEIRGYAGTDGWPNAAKLDSDMKKWRAWLNEQPEATGAIAYHGYSLGGGIVSQLARSHPPDLLVLQSTFTDIPRLAPVPVPPFLVENEFDSLSVVEKFDGPVVVIHGEEDGLIPIEHGEELAAAAGVDLIRFEGGHAWPGEDGLAAMWQAIDAAAK